jgi:hypothetical protein
MPGSQLIRILTDFMIRLPILVPKIWRKSRDDLGIGISQMTPVALRFVGIVFVFKLSTALR